MHSPCGSIPIAGPTPCCTNPAFHFPSQGKTRSLSSQKPSGDFCAQAGPQEKHLVCSAAPSAHTACSRNTVREEKTHSERLPKYQSAVQSPGEERFSSPAEAAVNKHGTCFISCQGCPLLSTDLTPAPRQKKSQELEAHQQQTVPPYFTGSGVASRSCLLRGNGRRPGEERCLSCTRRRTAEQIPERAQHKGTLGQRLHHTAQVLLSKAQLQTNQF